MADFILVLPILTLQLISAYFFLKGKIRNSLIILFITGILIRLYFINIDPFLHDWDEKYHALVAKNLSLHFLLPTLIENPILPYDKCGWWGDNHVWLHKQPLFLWQMALAIKIFGANIYAVRLPSLIMSSLLIPILFDIGKRTAGITVGFLAAFIFTSYEPVLQLVSGLAGMEHNDIAFLFYVSLSVWAWIRFEISDKKRWVILMGIFVGCAILCKWLTGLMVFLSFGFYHLVFKKNFFSRPTIIALIYAIIFCVAIALPWQIFIIRHYPVEAFFEYKYNSLHFTKLLEVYEQPTWFYLDLLKMQYKSLFVLALIGLLYTLISSRRYEKIISCFFMVFIVFAFFTVAKTKLPSYTIVVAPIIIIFISIGISILYDWLSKFDKWTFFLRMVVFLALIMSFYDFSRIQEFYFDKTNLTGQMRTQKLRELEEYKLIKGRLPSNSVIVRLPGFSSIDARFFTDYNCYGPCGDAAIIKLRARGYKVFIHPEELDYARATF